MKIRYAVFTLICMTILLTPLFADSETAGAKPSAAPMESVTHHKIAIGKDVLSYTAVAGDTFLKDRDGDPQASIFSISYLAEGVADPVKRPLIFLFNGGPGSSAIWLHLGAFGPRRVKFSDDAQNPGAPPYQLADNPDTLLKYADLVFVDPVGTGYSRALGKKADADYWGVDEDGASMAAFIRNYLTKNRRWNSPLYLAGESYGTIRASEIVKQLELPLLDSVAFGGVILLSSALDVRAFMPAGPANELPYITDLPTMAATAYYHNALPEKPADLEKFLQEVRDFASTEYLTALFAGDTLPEQQAEQIAGKLHRYTGLSVEYLKQTRLRIDAGRFLKELLRSRGQTLAIHDTRFLGKDPDDAGEGVQFDPFLFGTAPPFVMCLNSYLTTDLGVSREQPYRVYSDEAHAAWKRTKSSTGYSDGYLYTMDPLVQAAATNKDFRIFVANGIHDMATPFFTTEYVFHHSGIPKDRITLKNYAGGHMMYLYGPSLQQMSSDIGAFLNR